MSAHHAVRRQISTHKKKGTVIARKLAHAKKAEARARENVHKLEKQLHAVHEQVKSAEHYLSSLPRAAAKKRKGRKKKR